MNMKFQRAIRRDNLKGPMQNVSPESAGNVRSYNNSPFTVLPQHIWSKHSNFLTEGCLLRTQKTSTDPLTNDCIYDDSHRSDRKMGMFYPVLQSSSSTGSETDLQQLGTFPPRPVTDDPILHAFNSPHTSSLLEGDVITGLDSDQYLEMDLLDMLVESSGRGGSQGIYHAKDSLTLCEKLRLQYLSKELDIPFDDNIENPTFDETLPVPQVSSLPVTGSDFGTNLHPSLTHLSDYICPTEQLADVAASHKQRIRWTTELHDLFVEAVKALGGPEIATPKSILGIMTVPGLTIYHVKSHLQKYRLAKDGPEQKQAKRAPSIVEKKAVSSRNDSDLLSPISSNMQVTEALRMQIEVQKLLHEQLQVQRELQLRIKQNGEFLKKLMEEQQKANPLLNLPSDVVSTSESRQMPSFPSAARSDTSLSHPSSDNLSPEGTLSEMSKCQKRTRGRGFSFS